MNIRSLVPALLLIAASAAAQIGDASHNVTVSVQQITLLQLDIGSVTMTMDGTGLLAGQDTMTTSDLSTTLFWGTNVSGIKATIFTDLPSPRYTLLAVAVNNTGGTSAAEQSLSLIPHDFLLDLGRSSGSSKIRYTGIATAEQGAGTDNHVITITVQGQ